jgi:hypothetical protein
MTDQNQEKKLIINEILSYYKISWAEFDQPTLLDQIKEIENPPVVAKSTTKESLIQLLLNEDKRILETQTIKELRSELIFQKKY